MSGILYPHNERAYRAALAMMEECGKAAVIHPTGTGKTFIGLQLCREHPQSRVCWLSSSEYIFRTQMENWQAAGGEALPNICFFTYAKLMQMTREELAQIRPAYIVLDEFHRCGAQMWGQGVRRLLELCPDSRLLGLSATSIRYLDNQRDMADELFDGNVAAEMTLGEAIVQGILKPPKYVQCVFSYQKDLERYRHRICRAKSAAVRDRAEELLEALRRALEQADGLDAVFQRHMADRTGKYLVFCAHRAHMDEMIAHVDQWFGGIDRESHVYRAYSDDPGTAPAFAAFKADSSPHLKLLFCIDMLNEGVHVDDVSGVILFRPTVSPVVYKQQIGRALCAGTSGVPVIFDVVNNIENLYSIGALRQEMDEAVGYFQFHGQGERIVNGRFQVVDELRDCRVLFERLEESLTASWELMYQHARAYYEQHGDLEVPRRYKTPEGYSLGNWLLTQRQVRAGDRYGSLSRRRIELLDQIGMVWEDKHTANWNRCYAALCRYRVEHGDLDVPVGYVTGDGIALGRLVSALRTARSRGTRSVYMSDERIRQLEELGMIWDKLDYQWERYYTACAAYYVEHRDLNIPARYVSAQGLRLGAWVRRMRQIRSGRSRGRLTQEQIRRLDEISMVWEDTYTQKWDYGYGQAVKWYRAHGDLAVPVAYVDEDGFALGRWLRRHTQVDAATGRRAIRLTPERRAKLEALGMRWERSGDPWEIRYALAEDYYRQHGDLKVPADHRPEGIWLGKWLNEQKQIYRGNWKGKALTADQVARLERIGMVWTKGWSRESPHTSRRSMVG